MTAFASPWAPWALILVLFGLAFGSGLLVRRVRGWARAGAAAAALFCGAAAIALATGATAMAARARMLAALRPEAGRMVEVEGARAFVTCDGRARGPTLVLIAGGYGAGGFMAPLRKALGPDRRVCLVDRPGTGFAGPAPADRSVSRVSREILLAVRGAGERGPLVLVGHSMGGLYAANLAQAFPRAVAGLVLLDPTPPQWFTEQRALYGCAPAQTGQLVAATAFGLGLIPALNPMHGPGATDQARVFGSRWSTLVDLESRPGTLLAAHRADQAACENPFDLVQAPGALGRTPILAIVQTETEPPEPPRSLSPRAAENWRRLHAEWPTAYTRLSADSRLLRAPPGAGHQFPIEKAAWTVQAMTPFLTTVEGK